MADETPDRETDTKEEEVSLGFFMDAVSGIVRAASGSMDQNACEQ